MTNTDRKAVHEWLKKVDQRVQTANTSLEMIENFLENTHMEIAKYDSDSISCFLDAHPQLAQSIIEGYQKMMKQMTQLKKEALLEIQSIQKPTVLIHSYIQKEESANFIDRQI